MHTRAYIYTKVALVSIYNYRSIVTTAHGASTAATFSYALYVVRVLVRYMEMKNIPMQKSKLKNVQRWNTFDRLPALNVPTVCSLLKHVCGRGWRTDQREREKSQGLTTRTFGMERASFTLLHRRPHGNVKARGSL